MSIGEEVFDVVIAGAGCGGLTAALFASLFGARVLVVERSPLVGGMAATSAGSVWIPNTLHAGQGKPADSMFAARRYLMASIGREADVDLVDAFLEWGPKAVALLEERTDLRFRPYPHHPDYLAKLPGAVLSGRALEPLPFDGRKLGKNFAMLRPPIPEFTILGGMMIDRSDIVQLLNMRRSLKSLAYSVRILARHAFDRLRYPRGTRLVMGNALVARLLHSVGSRDVAIWTRSEILGLAHVGGSSMRLTVSRDGATIPIHARKALVLATGGINRDPELRLGLPDKAGIHTPGPDLADMSGPTGQKLAASFGVNPEAASPDKLLWAPVSVRRRKNGSEAVFPHFVFDRSKPGTLVVNELGLRYLNESLPYHFFGLEMIREHCRRDKAATYLIADAQAVQRYGLGMVRPGGLGLRKALADGYVHEGQSLSQLATGIGIDPRTLAATVDRSNEYSIRGVDGDFHRGESNYERNLGDPSVGPNPTLRLIAQGPFYALRLYPGDIGASAGLKTDRFGRVLAGGEPVEGLYAVGNDMQSVMGRSYPGPGITLGAAIAFSYAVACHATGRPA
jgi:succinate dehydrogenase/fumarate reductase flavoprotein subunit